MRTQRFPKKGYIQLPSRKSEITIIPLGCVHIGSRGADKDLFCDTVKEIRRRPNTYWIGMGDLAECIIETDPRYLKRHVDPAFHACEDLAGAQYNYLEHLLRPIADSCLGLHDGNHEWKIIEHHQRNLVLDLCRKLRVPYLEWMAITRLAFKRLSGAGIYNYDLLSVHGCGTARTPGAKINRLRDLMANFDADIYLRAHVHTDELKRQSVIYMDRAGVITQRLKVATHTGSYLKAYDKNQSGYAERRELEPSILGSPRIVIRPFAREWTQTVKVHT